MPPYPTTTADNDILTEEAKYMNLVHEKLIRLSYDISDNKETTSRLLDERKVLKCMLSAYLKAGLEEQANTTKIKLKDNMTFLNLIAEDQKNNKRLHSAFSASLGNAVQQFNHGTEE